jgi:membrane protease YdiL (CAAX protease family)
MVRRTARVREPRTVADTCHRPPSGAGARNAWALALVVVALVAVNVLDHFGPRGTPLVVGPVVALGLVVLARRAGLGWRELGLARSTWRRGARWALAETGLVAAGYAVAVAIPALRLGFRDARYDRPALAALLAAFVVIPVGTVLLEEVAFRGVLWGWIQRAHGAVYATAWSSVLFGLWHVLPSLGLGRVNEGVAAVAGRGTAGQVAPIAGAVIFTGLSGVLLCELRRRSGSLLAPIGLHWAVNGVGLLAAAAVQATGP